MFGYQRLTCSTNSAWEGKEKSSSMNFGSCIISHIVGREVQSSQKIQSQVNSNGEKEEAFVYAWRGAYCLDNLNSTSGAISWAYESGCSSACIWDVFLQYWLKPLLVPLLFCISFCALILHFLCSPVHWMTPVSTGCWRCGVVCTSQQLPRGKLCGYYVKIQDFDT